MLYTVTVAVCLATTPMQECSEANSVVWIVAPEHPGSMTGCIRHGMLYIAFTPQHGILYEIVSGRVEIRISEKPSGPRRREYREYAKSADGRIIEVTNSRV